MERRTRIPFVATLVAIALLWNLPATSASAGTSPPLVAWGDLPRDPTWTAEVRHGSAIFEPAFTDELVVVGTSRGATVFPRACDPTCEPLWRTALPAERFDAYEVGAGDGLVAVANGDDRLAVFPEDCRSDGGVCEPTWTAEGRYHAPTVHNGAIVALISERREAGLAVFPASCTDPCEPSYAFTRERRSWLLIHIEIANDVAYFVMNPRLYGVSLDCASGGACGLAFRARRGDNPTPPAVVDGRIVFSSGGEPREVVAYDEGCTLPCEPVWTASTAFNDQAPVPGPGLAFTTSLRGIVAWPVDCTDPCQPAWTARMPGGLDVDHVTDRWVVASSYRDHRVAVFPIDCDERCRPAWSDRFRQRIFEVSGSGNGFAVTQERRVLGYRLWCGGRCRPAWRGRLPGGEPWWPDLRPSSFVVYARGGGVTGEGGVLTGFVADSA